MALNIKNQEVERLAAEVSELTGESKTQAIRKALEERKERLELAHANLYEDRKERLQTFLETQVWPKVPDELRGKSISQEEQDEILGYGPEGF